MPPKIIAWRIIYGASGTVVAASAPGALSLKSGTHGAGDPQYYAHSPVHVPKVAKVQVVRDGETVQVGPIGITAHMTPGTRPAAPAGRGPRAKTSAA